MRAHKRRTHRPTTRRQAPRTTATEPNLPREVTEELDRRFDAIEAQLTVDERALLDAALALDDVPHRIMERFGRAVLDLSAEEAARHMREHLFAELRAFMGRGQAGGGS